jgi:glycosyltransferase involved in cell wall biosynthesis
VRARLGLTGRRYLLHTGGHDRVKNLAKLLEAFAPLARAAPDLDLVITGEHTADTGRVIRGASAVGLLSRVRLPGWVPRDDLIALYRGASVVVYPSLAEGFGIPLMEAMVCGAPVVAAAAGALPEVAGDACLLVAPHDAQAMGAAVAGILGDPALRDQLSRLGRERSALFSWRETARLTLQVYREVAA